jgi:thiamine-monophosphate kinase
LVEGRWLTANFPIHAMIDLSDGLAGDLRHILRASGVGAELLASAIPISPTARSQARNDSSAKSPLLAALTDGEDFELLFALPSSQAVPLLDAWRAQFSEVRLACVGKITAGPTLKIRTEDGVRELTERGYTHFE